MEHAAGAMATIGLRHVLEDGAAVLEGHGLDGSRRKFVLEDLKDMLEEAMKGATVTEAPQSLIRGGDPSAIRVYSLIFRHLSSDYKGELTTEIRNTYDTISSVAQGREPNPAEKEAAQKFVRRLLARLNSDEVYSPLKEPEVFSFQ